MKRSDNITAYNWANHQAYVRSDGPKVNNPDASMRIKHILYAPSDDCARNSGENPTK